VSAILTVAEMQLRELARRRIAVALLVALPLSIYLSIPADQYWALAPGVVGLGWSVGGAAMFAALGWRRVDPRLSLAGLRPVAQILGRALPVAALGLVLGGLILPLILIRSDLHDGGTVALAIALTVSVGVPLGLAIGSLLPREMEAMLVLIGVGGISMSMPPDIAGAQALPLWGPVRLLQTVVEVDGAGVLGPIAHAAGSAVVLGLVAWIGFHRRVRIRGAESATTSAATRGAA
jgi:hypothetical protein